MTEELLQFIWLHQYFNKTELVTEQLQQLQIVQPGILNKNQGPDFINAAIIVDGIKLYGSIELHVKTSLWKKHKHSTDDNYKNVILHVVWKNDVAIHTLNPALPVLVLENIVAKLLLQKYQQLMDADKRLPCSNYLPVLHELSWVAFKEKLLVERLQEKYAGIAVLLVQTNYHWEEVFWYKLAYNFGLKVNAALFEAVAKTISINILAKHKNQLQQLEALLLGQANLLQDDSNIIQDKYYSLLQKEYHFLKTKYALQKVHEQPMFLRMRPAAFPTIRLAQLAMLIHNSTHLFATIKETETVNDLRKLLNVTASDYWHYHYTFKESSAYKEKQLGSQMMDSIIINTIVPVVFAYGKYYNNQSLKDKAVQWLQHIKAENNAILQLYLKYHVKNSSAADSQALLYLYKKYCTTKQCLQCAVGNAILKNVTK
jgi:hypothetical protein